MAWSPSPTVAAARDFGQRFGCDQVIIIGIYPDHDHYLAVSWGETKPLCTQAESLLDAICKRIDSGDI